MIEDGYLAVFMFKGSKTEKKNSKAKWLIKNSKAFIISFVVFGCFLSSLILLSTLILASAGRLQRSVKFS